MSFVQHFGVNVTEKSSGLKLTRENYLEKIVFKDSSSKKYYPDSKMDSEIEARLSNYDLNIRYFKSLSITDFNKKIKSFISKNKNFEEITNLNTVDGKSGYYIMVLGEYAQIYIGTSIDIKKRIRHHWNRQWYFDRMIFGSIENSILSIDSFRAFDTTRIFVYPTPNIYNLENNFIEQFDKRYCLNRTAGGNLSGLEEAVVNRKTRNLSDLEEIKN